MKKLYLFALLLVMNLLPTMAVDITVDNTTRSYLIYVPQNLGANRPLLISCHGMNQDAAYQRNMLQIESVADTAKFVTVFPQGIGNSWELSGNRDLRFMEAIIDKMATQYHIDRNRVYLSGFSMGGMFTYHAMNHLCDKIAAFAPISGYPMGGASATSSRPVPIIHTHGTADDVVNFGGVSGTLATWVRHNGCPTQAKVQRSYRGAQHITRHTWGPGRGGVEVVLMELEGKGHWISNDIVLTGDEIWKFCKRFSLDLHDPTVNITLPARGTAYTTLGGDAQAIDLEVEATAYDPDGTVSNVSFYDNGELIGTLAAQPYRLTWQGVTAGSHKLLAIVTDDEGRTGRDSLVVSVNAPKGAYSLTSNFASAGQGSVPAGWESFDGNEHRVGLSSGYSSGPRIFRMTGTRHDFDYGFYNRNATGALHAGYAKYASPSTTASLTLSPGIYELRSLVANWNRPEKCDVTVAIETVDGQQLASYTFTPTSNVGNAATNSFSGTTWHTFFFRVDSQQRYVVAYYAKDEAWSDLLLGGATIGLSEDELATVKCTFYESLSHAVALLAETTSDIYDGIERTTLRQLVTQYTPFTSTDAMAYEAATAALNSATQALLQHKQAVDGREVRVTVFEDRFAQSGAGTLPRGWVTYDGSDKRVGPLSGLAQGARIFQMTGAKHDFDYGLYIRNIDGRANEGYAKFGTTDSDTTLTLQKGAHHLSLTLCNWNRQNFDEIRFRIVSRTGNRELLSHAVTPTCNIGNSASNSFSGATQVSIDFDVAAAGAYVLEFYTADAGWADAMIADILITRSDYNTQSVATPRNGAQPVGVTYYSLSGVRLSAPPSGVSIERTVNADGSTVSRIVQR